MGHQSLAMVLRYVGLAPNHKVKAVELLDNALGETQSIQFRNLDNCKLS